MPVGPPAAAGPVWQGEESRGPAPDGQEPQGPESPGDDIVRRRDAAARLGDDIAKLAARIQAATYELLVMLREFDAQEGWAGFPSCAHWLHWRTGLAPGAAREKVRVARALGELPLLSAAMRQGQLSYSKVRALTRVATPANEARLLDCARCATAAQVERLTRAWQQVDRQAEADADRLRHEGRELQTWVDDDGMVVVRGRLAPEVGAVVRQALEAAADRLRAEVSPDEAAETSTGQRRADALGLVAESALAGGLDRGTAGDRYQVVLHVEAEALQAAAPEADAPAARADIERLPGQAGAAGAEDDGGRQPAALPDAAGAEEAGAVRVSAETSRESGTAEAGAAGAGAEDVGERQSAPAPGAAGHAETAGGRVSAETRRGSGGADGHVAASRPEDEAAAGDASGPDSAEAAAGAEVAAAGTGGQERAEAAAEADAPACGCGGTAEAGAQAACPQPAAPGAPAGQAALEDADGLRVSAETSRRLACDAALVVMRHAGDGAVLDVGRRTRTVPPALRRALEARDRHCRFPGCQARRCDLHHVEHWADGGATKLSNLVRLCRRHHRAVHEEGFTVRLGPDGAAEFRWPDGRLLSAAPPAEEWTGPALAPTAGRLRAAGIRIGPDTATPAGGGGRLDLGYAIDVLWTSRTDAGKPEASGPAPPA